MINIMKSSISREKLYSKNYIEDSKIIEKYLTNKEVESYYDSLSEILTLMYKEVR